MFVVFVFFDNTLASNDIPLRSFLVTLHSSFMIRSNTAQLYWSVGQQLFKCTRSWYPMI